MAIPVNLGGVQGGGFIDLASLQQRQAQINYERQQNAQNQMLSALATLGQYMQQEQMKKHAQKTLDELKKGGYDLEYQIDPMTGESKVGAKRIRSLAEQLAGTGMFPFLPTETQQELIKQGTTQFPSINDISEEDIDLAIQKKQLQMLNQPLSWR